MERLSRKVEFLSRSWSLRKCNGRWFHSHLQTPHCWLKGIDKDREHFVCFSPVWRHTGKYCHSLSKWPINGQNLYWQLVWQHHFSSRINSCISIYEMFLNNRWKIILVMRSLAQVLLLTLQFRVMEAPFTHCAIKMNLFWPPLMIWISRSPISVPFQLWLRGSGSFWAELHPLLSGLAFQIFALTASQTRRQGTIQQSGFVRRFDGRIDIDTNHISTENKFSIKRSQ